MYLYEKINQAKNFSAYAELPRLIPDNLNNKFELRSYQKEAFQNFITYFENDKLRAKPTQTLFHMATGSGKTLIMAGLIIYLYHKGYRNFLFFVNSTNIVQKTKENFLNSISSKYLFTENIIIDGELVPIKEVSNFQFTDTNAINICFTTIQGLHADMWFAKENSMTNDDFINKKTVFISDEAHHLNALTKKGLTKSEKENSHSWEETIKGIFEVSVDNVLLEFTATLEKENPYIAKEYTNKIIFNYPLEKFRLDKYSKEIMTLRSDLSPIDRALQAIMLSQYRLKIFQEHKLDIKPVVLFKAYTIKESTNFMATFLEKISNLTGNELEQIKMSTTSNKIMQQAYKYFADKNIDFDELASELKDDFSENHCISANEDKDVAKNQILLNSLEDKNNPYRVVFEVKKLDEGWDVLNLFDIVRLYETRQSSGTHISQTTISEAQLIGRGARYCPFQLNEEQSKYQRKYDNDVENNMRVCETLYYHCYNEHRYITELHYALKEIGMEADVHPLPHTLKSSFKEDTLYTQGKIFINKRKEINRQTITGIKESIRNKVYTISIATGVSGTDMIMEDDTSIIDYKANINTTTFKIKELAQINYSLIHKALLKHSIFKFNILKSYFPNLKSTRQFIMDENYLGDIRICIKSQYDKNNIPMNILFSAVNIFINKITSVISNIDVTYEGTKEFYPYRISDIFKDKMVIYNKTHEGGIGYSQNDLSVNEDYRIDLAQEDWFAFEENWGTDEEKAFVGYFKEHIDELRKKYNKIFLIRNERQFHLYSFDDGERFEPDFVIFLQKNNQEGYEQLQIFVEPKGSHLIEQDKWKENFLLQIKENARTVIKFISDNKYNVWGFHFFNRNIRTKEFNDDFKMLLTD